MFLQEAQLHFYRDVKQSRDEGRALERVTDGIGVKQKSWTEDRRIQGVMDGGMDKLLILIR